MEQASDGNGGLDNTSPKAKSVMQSFRHSLPTIGTRGREPTSPSTPKLLHEKPAGGDGGNEADGNEATAVAGVKGNGRGSGGGGEGGGNSGGGGTTDAAAAIAVAAAAAELAAAALASSSPAAAETPDAAPNQNPDLEPSVGKQAEEHLSCKYTKEELLARHWGMNLKQMKRVKALLRMGVCEEDLEIADRLLKMGRDISKDTPLTKEEQLLGYTSTQRQRMKALQILGLTEESFERCRAVMLSSLGPSAFGYTTDETAKSAARAEAEEGWTPGDKFRRRGPGPHFGGDGGGGLPSNLLRMPTFGMNSSQHHPHIYDCGGSGRHRIGMDQKGRRASDSDKGCHLPDVITMKRRAARGAGGGAVAVAVAMPPLETVVGSRRVNSPPGIATPLSTSSDPR